MRYLQKLSIGLIIVFFACGANSYNVRLNKSQSLFRNLQYDIAKIEIMKLINDFPGEPEPYYMLGLVNYSTKKYVDCLLNFNKAEQRGLKKTSDLFLYKGIASYNIGDMNEAEKNLSACTELRSNGEAYKYLGPPKLHHQS